MLIDLWVRGAYHIRRLPPPSHQPISLTDIEKNYFLFFSTNSCGIEHLSFLSEQRERIYRISGCLYFQPCMRKWWELLGPLDTRNQVKQKFKMTANLFDCSISPRSRGLSVSFRPKSTQFFDIIGFWCRT